MRISDWSSDVCSSDLGQLEFDRLERRETLAAGLALAPATDRRAVLADARVDDAGVCVLAEEAVHQRPSTIDRELRALLQHVLAHARDDLLVLRVVQHVAHPVGYRKSGVKGKSVSVRLDLGGRRFIKQKKYKISR